jgi:hypothetical protein
MSSRLGPDDDTPPAGVPVPRPRSSGQTMVGLGAVESPTPRSDPPTTPPHGTDLRGADTKLVLERVGLADSHAVDRLDSLEEKVDALLSDVRRIVGDLRTRDEALFGLLGLPGQVEQLARRLEDVARRVGAVERAPREGSSPQLEALASLALEDAETEVRRRRAQVAEDEQRRQLRAQNRARLWGWVWKIAAVVGPLLGAVVARECGGG